MGLKAGVNIWTTGDALQNPEISPATPTQEGSIDVIIGVIGVAADYGYNHGSGALGFIGKAEEYIDGSAEGQIAVRGVAADYDYSYGEGYLGLSGGGYQSIVPNISWGSGHMNLLGEAAGYTWGYGDADGGLAVRGVGADYAYSYGEGQLGLFGSGNDYNIPNGGYVLLTGLQGLSTTPRLDHEEHLTITSSAMSDQFAQIKEHLVAHIQQQSHLSGLATTTEVLVARVEAFLPIVAGIVEDLEISDDLDALTIRLVDVAQELYLSSDVSTLAQFSAATVLYLSARDAVMSGYSIVSSEALELDEALLAGLRANVDSIVELVADTAVTSGMTLTVTASDSVLIDDAASSLAQLIAQVDEGLDAYVTIRVGDEVIHGWVVNTQNAAFSEYQNFPFNSLVEYGGRYYGLASDGLYLLDGPTDEGAEITAAVKTGLLDMGTHYLKDAKAAHLGYNSTGELVLKVVTTDAGEKVEHWYKMKPADAEEVRDGRVVIGRGMRARYWQFELVNVAGADFEIDDVTLMYQVLSRRIRS